MSLSKKPGFSAEELAALSIWDAPEVGQATAQARSENVQLNESAGKLLTVDEIDATQKQAFAEAYAEGQKAGHAEGYQQGLQQGLEEGRKKGYDENLHLLRKQAAELVSLLESFAEPFKELDEKVEQELVKLAIGIADQIIRREIKTDPGQVIAAVRAAVSILPLSAQKIALHLHPEDAELVRSTLALDDMSPAWEIVEEPLITRGGCKVITETSQVDASVENRTAAVIANVLGDQRNRDENA